MFQWITQRVILIVSATLMVLALCWLTVSLPFIARAKQHITNLKNTQQDTDTNTPTNTTEEKVPQTINEEYLHHEELSLNEKAIISLEHNHHRSSNLPHVHFELITPPPKS